MCQSRTSAHIQQRLNTYRHSILLSEKEVRHPTGPEAHVGTRTKDTPYGHLCGLRVGEKQPRPRINAVVERR